MNRLPADILIDILCRLPIKSLMRCRCVCKSLLNLTRDSRFTQAHLSRSSLTNPPLLLNQLHFVDSDMYFAEHEQTNGYTCTKLNLFASNFNETQFRVVGSCNGLLCLVHHQFCHMICVCNPFTRECIKLPYRIDSSQRGREVEAVIGFGFSAKMSEYKVVEMIHCSSGVSPWSDVFVYGLGDKSWRGIGGVPYAVMRRLGSIAFVNGALHWVCYSPAGLIVSLDIADEVFDVIPQPEFGLLRQGCYSLGELNGCLSITDSSFYDRVEIWMMQCYKTKESWNKCFAINFNQVQWNIRFAQTVCLQRDGKLLLLYNKEALLLYDPQTVNLRMLSISGIPYCFEAFNHVASLVSPWGCLRSDR